MKPLWVMSLAVSAFACGVFVVVPGEAWFWLPWATFWVIVSAAALGE